MHNASTSTERVVAQAGPSTDCCPLGLRGTTCHLIVTMMSTIAEEKKILSCCETFSSDLRI